MELCATNKEEQLQGDPDDVHITSTLLEPCEFPKPTTKLLKADLSKCVVNREGDEPLDSFIPTKPDVAFDRDEAVSEEENVKSMLQMFNILHAKKRVRFEALVLNRESFSRTAANILTLSLLVKDGRAEVKNDQDSYFIVPKNAVTEPCDENNIKFMYHFTHNDWELMQQQVQVGEELMSKTDQSWPGVIPKGIRKKARKRAVFVHLSIPPETNAMTSVDNAGASDRPLEHDTVMATDADDESTDMDATETKALKPVLTYSRRQKQQSDAASLQLLKRYKKRMLDGGGYTTTKTLLFLEEMMSGKAKAKAGDDGETIFERLARAPRRRRSGYTGEEYSVNDTGASQDAALQVFPAEANDIRADDDAEKPFVIAPKRFKKSAFPPRRALIARIKARLKAILKHQPVTSPKK